MTTTRPESSSLPPRRADQPLFAARKREPKYFSLSGDTAAPTAPGTAVTDVQRGAQERSPNTHARAHSYGPETGIPRPATTLKGAWERALLEEQEVGGGSPSPASRRRGGAKTEQISRRDGRSLDLWRRSAGSPRLHEVDDGDTVGSGSLTGSMDDGEDELDRKISKFARDEERARRLARGGELFARQTGPRVAEAGQTLQRRASGSEDVEPGVRIPAQWGRRARKSNGKWMHRIMSPDSSVEVDVPATKAREAEDAIDLAEAAADTPLPTVERDTVQQLPSPRSRPMSVQPEKSQFWDADLDFTATSVMGNESPQLRVRNAKLDEIREREMEGLSKHAVASARLEEIRERLSEDRSLSPEVAKTTVREATRIPSPVVRNPNYRRTSTESFEIVENAGKSLEAGPATERLFGEIKGPKTEPERVPNEIQRGRRSRSRERPAIARASPSPSTQVEPDHFHEKTILEEEGEQIPGTPITIFRNTDRPQDGHKREDSYDTLRRLAAITSQSPSPIPPKQEDKLPDDTQRRQPTTSAPDSKRHSRSSSLPKSDVDPEERIAAEKDLFEIPDSKSERNSMREPSPVEVEEETPVEETPRPKQHRLSMPTPVVTGAFIETPAPATRHTKVRSPSPAPEKANPKQDDKPKPKPAVKNESKDPTPLSHSSSSTRSSSQPRKPTDEASAPNRQIERLKPAPRPRPRLTNSAPPSSAVADLLRIQNEAAIEDSTLDDLADLLSAFPEPKGAPAPIPVPDLELDERGRPLSAGARERRIRERQLDKMERGLSHGLESIRDAKRGIAKLEQAVSAAPLGAVSKELNELLPEDRVVCSRCASRSNVYHLTIPLPRLWWRDTSRRTGVRLTWWGLLVLLYVVWYVAESVAFACIGKPEYVSHGNYDLYGPPWGWSLIRLGQRAGGWVWSVWTDGGMDMGRKGGGGMGSVVGGGGGVWEDGSMLEDEVM